MVCSVQNVSSQYFNWLTINIWMRFFPTLQKQAWKWRDCNCIYGFVDDYKKEIWAFSRLGQFSSEAKKFEGSISSLKEKLNEFQENEEKMMAEKKSVDVRQSFVISFALNFCCLYWLIGLGWSFCINFQFIVYQKFLGSPPCFSQCWGRTWSTLTWALFILPLSPWKTIGTFPNTTIS